MRNGVEGGSGPTAHDIGHVVRISILLPQGIDL